MKIGIKKLRKPETDNKFKEACEWLLDIKSGTPPPEVMDGFPDWIEASRSHSSELHLMSSVWNAMGELKDDPLIVRTLEKSLKHERRQTRRKWFYNISLNAPWFRYTAVTVSLLLIVGVIWLIQTSVQHPVIYRTAVGEQRALFLPDGSMVHIDTNTTIAESFTKELRHVELMEGKAVFSVAHESQRPFIVVSGPVVTHALGTEFEVHRRKEGKTTISVTEGRVQVTTKKANHLTNIKKGPPPSIKSSKPEPAFLASKTDAYANLSEEILVTGQEMEVDEQESKYVIKSFNTSNVKAWQEGRLCFQDKPLSIVIEELNRYMDQKIVIGDDRLKSLNINVYFRLADRKDFVSTLESAFPIITRSVSNDEVVLVKKENAK